MAIDPSMILRLFKTTTKGLVAIPNGPDETSDAKPAEYTNIRLISRRTSFREI